MKTSLLFMLAAGVCQAQAINPRVTQENIQQTICVKGWTATVRPGEAYTENLKRKQIRRLRLPGGLRAYEEDHIIPLELGGAPADARNLTPERWPAARRKDRMELMLNGAVCAGRMTLADAQKKIANYDPSEKR